ncbi:MAG: outer membrane beta-barrel protein [Saprospiraceae bacterium]
MKKYILLGLCLLFYFSGSAQPEFTAEASQLFTSFKFKDSQGEKHNGDYQSIITSGYGIGMRYVTGGGIAFRAGIGLRNGGANLVYDNNNYDWKLQYLDLKLGAGYMLQFKNIKPYVMVLGYYGSLLRGTQTLNNENFNITKSGILKNRDFGLQFNPGLNIKVNHFISTYIEFQYLMGLANLEVNPPQESKNTAFGATLGFSFLLEEKN